MNSNFLEKQKKWWQRNLTHILFATLFITDYWGVITPYEHLYSKDVSIGLNLLFATSIHLFFKIENVYKYSYTFFFWINAVLQIFASIILDIQLIYFQTITIGLPLLFIIIHKIRQSSIKERYLSPNKTYIIFRDSKNINATQFFTFIIKSKVIKGYYKNGKLLCIKKYWMIKDEQMDKAFAKEIKPFNFNNMLGKKWRLFSNCLTPKQ